MFKVTTLRDVSLVSLLFFGSSCSCVIVKGTPPPQQQAANRPKPIKKPAPAPAKPAGKPVKPETKPAPKPIPKPRPKPAPKPAPEPEPPPPPAIPNSTHMVVPVRVDFDDAVAKIDSMVVKTMTQDWKVVSGPKDPTKVEVRYTVWRDPIKASFADGTLAVTVNVRYAADVRASAANPLGKGRIWITKGETWGTKSEPQHVNAKFHAKLKVKDDFTVAADVGLDDIDHGAAPTGNVCVKALVNLCVSKETIAPMVRKNLEKPLVPQIEKALGDADTQIEKALNLKPHAQKLWTALQQPQPLQKIGDANCPTELGALCKSSAWLVARPESVALSQPRMDGDDLRVDIGFAGQLAVELGRKPVVKPAPLPKLKTTTDPPGFAVHARIELPLDALSAEIAKQIAGKSLDVRGAPDLVVTSVTLVNHADPGNPRKIHVVVSVSGGDFKADVVLAGEVAWDARRREVYLKDFDYTVDTTNAQLQALSEANHAALKKRIAKLAHWKIDGRRAALGEAITKSLGNVWAGHLQVSGELEHLAVDDVQVGKDALTADVVVAGQLAIGFKP